MKYRVENKYLVYEDQIAYLMARLDSFVKLDPMAENGQYLIRSIYFDDYDNHSLDENESGQDEREKFRIRSYNNQSDLLKLELKGKKSGYTRKASELISKEDTEMIMRGRGMQELHFLESDGFLKKKMYAQMCTKLLHGVAIVEYERTAFIDPIGNVRITFDKNIGGTSQIETFFDERIPSVPVLDTGQHILEVKYDEILPDYIRTILDTGSLTKTSFSKFYYTLRRQNI